MCMWLWTGANTCFYGNVYGVRARPAAAPARRASWSASAIARVLTFTRPCHMTKPCCFGHVYFARRSDVFYKKTHEASFVIRYSKGNFLLLEELRVCVCICTVSILCQQSELHIILTCHCWLTSPARCAPSGQVMAVRRTLWILHQVKRWELKLIELMVTWLLGMNVSSVLCVCELHIVQ